MTNTQLIKQLDQIQQAPGLNQALLEYMLILLLKHAPEEKNHEIEDIMKQKDLDAMTSLLIEHVPEIEEKVIQFIEAYER